MRYIGSKINLLPEIRSFVEKQAPKSTSLCDIFAGTGVVGREFKATHSLICNDILYFSYVLNCAHNGLNKIPRFLKLRKELGKDPIEFLNDLFVATSEVTEKDFMTSSFSPAGTAGRQYLTPINALKIDRIRQTLDIWLTSNLISKSEFHYLLAILIENVPSVSNTTGTYGAYLKKWDNRALKPLTLRHLDIVESDQKNIVFNQDANKLIKAISGDVLYLDTPYNGRQYSSNYHLLESLAKYDYAQLKGVTGTRIDTSGESAYCKKRTAYDSFDDLIGNAQFKSVVVSYSSDGILSENQLIDLLSKHGKKPSLKVCKIPYRRYKRTANDPRNVLEYLLAINL